MKPLSIKLPDDVIRRVDDVRRELEAAEEGLEISRASTIRVLLQQALSRRGR